MTDRDRRRNDAGKTAVRVIVAPGKTHDVLPGYAPRTRLGDLQAGLRVVSQMKEVVTVGPADVIRSVHVLAKNDLAFGVGCPQAFDLWQARSQAGEEGIGGRFVESACGQAAFQLVDRGVQEQVDSFDAAGDILVDGVGDVLGQVLGSLFVLKPALVKKEAAERCNE